MNCHHCDAGLSDEARFCSACGAACGSGAVDDRPSLIDPIRMEAARRFAKAAAKNVVVVGKSVLKSPTGQDMAKGAAAGAVIAIPIPFVGPALGAAVGAGLVAYAKILRK